MSTIGSGQSLAGYFFGLHIDAYRRLQQYTIVDYSLCLTLRATNALSIRFFDVPMVSEEETKTISERQKEQIAILLRAKLESKPGYVQFSRVAAQYVELIIPKLVAEKLLNILPNPENQLLYQLGLIVRYVNYQIDKQTGYRKAFVDSRLGEAVSRVFTGVKAQVAHATFSKKNLLPFLNVEHLLLELFEKISRPKEPTDRAFNVTALVIKSIASSLVCQKEIDAFLGQYTFHSDEEKMIARLQWHAKNESAPKRIKRRLRDENTQTEDLKALPDPEHVPLDISNVSAKLDEQLTKYLEGEIEELLEKHGPQSLKNGFLGFIYELEGRDLIIKLLTTLFVQYGFKQVADSHLCCTGILSALGVDTTEYEIEGFGLRQTQNILGIAQEMLLKMQEPGQNAAAVHFLFKRSGLKCSPLSLVGIEQKEEAKKCLKQHLSKLLYDLIKEDPTCPAGSVTFNRIGKRLDELPFVGVATMVLRGIVNSLFFSYNYYQKESQKSYFSYMASYLVGQRLCDYVSDRIVELIYHPTWRITLTKLLVDLLDNHFERTLDETSIRETHLKDISAFLFDHFTYNPPVALDGIAYLLPAVVWDQAVDQIKQLLKPVKDKPPFIEKIIAAVVPTIEECILYCKVCELIRKRGITFEGDAKFWEVFVYQTLNERVVKAFKWEKQPDLKARATHRSQLVGEMLAYTGDELFTNLATSAVDIRLPAMRTVVESALWDSSVRLPDYAPSRSSDPPVVTRSGEIRISENYVPIPSSTPKQ
jgi:hypothetical protein